MPPLGMFVPALVAIFMRTTSKAHWVFRSFVLLVLVQLLTAVLAESTNIPGSILGGMATWSMIGWTLLIIRLYRIRGEESFAEVGLQLGDRSVGFKIAFGFVLFLVLQAILDLAFGTGRSILGTVPVLQMDLPAWFDPIPFIFMLALSIVGTPLGALALFFGEEYGWRGFLQDALEPIGRRRAALLIGLIWGIWHIPIILSGIHTYPPTGPGFLLAAVFFSLWGFVQSYAVYKTGSIWSAAVLHGIFNGLFHFLRSYVVKPEDKIFSFGLGLYGVMCLVVVVLFLSQDPIWDSDRREGTRIP